MGWFIFVFPERLVGDSHEIIPEFKVFNWRTYGMFGFLGGFESKAGVPALAEQRSIPLDSALYEPFLSGKSVGGTFGMSWLTVQELLNFDYDATFYGTFRIVEENDDGSFSYHEDAGAVTEMSFRRFLGLDFFTDLDRLAASGADRIVFFYA